MSERPSTNLWLLLEVLARRRGLIFTVVILATAIAVVISLLLPKWYTSTGLLLPPPDDSTARGLAKLAQVELLGGGDRLPGMITLNDVYARILRSRRMSDSIIEQFNLKEYYHEPSMMGLYDLLGKRAGVRVTDEGLLEVSFEDKNPQMASDIATAYLEELIRINHDVVTASARKKREFIEARLGEVSDNLRASRNDLEQFQSENKAIDFAEQTRMAIAQATDLKITKAELQLQIDLDREFYMDDNPVIEEKLSQLAAIDRRLAALEYGGTDSSYFSLPIASIPALQGRFESLNSKVAANDSLHSVLLGLLEQARIQEKDQGPQISVLDWPSVPDLRSHPQRTIIVMGTFGVSLIFAVLLAAFLEQLRRMREAQSEDYQRLLLFANAFLGWLPGVRKPKRSP